MPEIECKGTMSNYLEENILNHVFRDEEYSASSNVYLALFDDSVSEEQLEENEIGGEITDYEGERKEIHFSEPEQDVDGRAYITNTGEDEEIDYYIEFQDMPEVTVNLGAVMDTQTTGEGNVLYWLVPVGDPREVQEGDFIRIPEQELVLTLD